MAPHWSHWRAMHWRTQGVPFPATRDPQGSLGTCVTSDECPVVAGVVTSGWEWHRESQKGRKSRAYSQLPVDRVGFAANSLEGSERACQCASMSVRPIRRSSIRAPPSTPFSSTKEPLGYQGAPSAPSLSTSNEWQFITSGSVSPTWTSSHLGPTEQF